MIEFLIDQKSDLYIKKNVYMYIVKEIERKKKRRHYRVPNIYIRYNNHLKKFCFILLLLFDINVSTFFFSSSSLFDIGQKRKNSLSLCSLLVRYLDRSGQLNYICTRFTSIPLTYSLLFSFSLLFKWTRNFKQNAREKRKRVQTRVKSFKYMTTSVGISSLVMLPNYSFSLYRFFFKYTVPFFFVRYKLNLCSVQLKLSLMAYFFFC